MRSVIRLLVRAGFLCDCIASDRRIARSGMVREAIPWEAAPGWVKAAIRWQSRTGGLVVPCEDEFVRQVRDAGIDADMKCRLLPLAVVALLAERLGIDTSSIAVVSGHGSPAKVVAVDGMDDEAIRAAFPREKRGKSTDVGTRE